MSSPRPAPSSGPERRYIVQLCAAASHVDDKDLIVARCNDGSVWIIVWGEKPGDERWMRLTDIPQDQRD